MYLIAAYEGVLTPLEATGRQQWKSSQAGLCKYNQFSGFDGGLHNHTGCIHFLRLKRKGSTFGCFYFQLLMRSFHLLQGQIVHLLLQLLARH